MINVLTRTIEPVYRTCDSQKREKNINNQKIKKKKEYNFDKQLHIALEDDCTF